MNHTSVLSYFISLFHCLHHGYHFVCRGHARKRKCNCAKNMERVALLKIEKLPTIFHALKYFKKCLRLSSLWDCFSDTCHRIRTWRLIWYFPICITKLSCCSQANFLLLPLPFKKLCLDKQLELCCLLKSSYLSLSCLQVWWNTKISPHTPEFCFYQDDVFCWANSLYCFAHPTPFMKTKNKLVWDTPWRAMP